MPCSPIPGCSARCVPCRAVPWQNVFLLHVGAEAGDGGGTWLVGHGTAQHSTAQHAGGGGAAVPVCKQPPSILLCDTRLHRLLVTLSGIQTQVEAPA